MLPSSWKVLLMSVALPLSLVAGAVIAQDKSDAPAEKPAIKSDSAAKKGAGNRLPNYWNQLNLTPDQLKKLNELRAKRREEIAAKFKEVNEARKKLADARKDLEGLMNEQTEDFKTVLTDEQRSRLGDLELAAKEKAAAKLQEQIEKAKKKSAEKPSDN